MRDDVKKMPELLLAQPFDGEVWGRGEAPAHDDAAAVAQFAVAWRTEDAVSRLSPLEHRPIDREWGVGQGLTSLDAGQEPCGIGPLRDFPWPKPGDRPGYELAGRRAILEEGTGFERFVPRLVIHLASAAAQQDQE
jgi:hypothetical protein